MKLEQIDGGTDARLILPSAPAGFGKSTLVSDGFPFFRCGSQVDLNPGLLVVKDGRHVGESDLIAELP